MSGGGEGGEETHTVVSTDCLRGRIGSRGDSYCGEYRVFEGEGRGEETRTVVSTECLGEEREERRLILW